MKMDEKRLYTDVHFSFILNIKVYVCQHKTQYKQKTKQKKNRKVLIF